MSVRKLDVTRIEMFGEAATFKKTKHIPITDEINLNKYLIEQRRKLKALQMTSPEIISNNKTFEEYIEPIEMDPLNEDIQIIEEILKQLPDDKPRIFDEKYVFDLFFFEYEYTNQNENITTSELFLDPTDPSDEEITDDELPYISYTDDDFLFCGKISIKSISVDSSDEYDHQIEFGDLIHKYGILQYANHLLLLGIKETDNIKRVVQNNAPEHLIECIYNESSTEELIKWYKLIYNCKKLATRHKYLADSWSAAYNTRLWYHVSPEPVVAPTSDCNTFSKMKSIHLENKDFYVSKMFNLQTEEMIKIYMEELGQDMNVIIMIQNNEENKRISCDDHGVIYINNEYTNNMMFSPLDNGSTLEIFMSPKYIKFEHKRNSIKLGECKVDLFSDKMANYSFQVIIGQSNGNGEYSLNI